MANQVVTIRPYNAATLPGTSIPTPNPAGAWTNQGGAGISQDLRDNSDTTFTRLALGTGVGSGNWFMQALAFDPSGLSLPSGSQVRELVGRVRWRWLNDGGAPSATLKFAVQKAGNWPNDIAYSQDANLLPPPSNFTTVSATPFFPANITDSGIAGQYFWYMNVTGTNQTANLALDGTIDIAEAYLDIYYNAPPTGTPSIDNINAGVVGSLTPTVRWAYADPEGDTQERYRVAIYSDALVVAAGGSFDPWNTLGNALTVAQGGTGFGAPAWISGGNWARTQQFASSLSDWNPTTTSTSSAVIVDAGALKPGVLYRAYVSVGDVGSGTRFGANQFVSFTVNIDPVLMPTLCLLPSNAAQTATATKNGGLSFNPVTGQIDSLVVGGRANVMAQIDASFESGAAGSLGGWVQSGGGTSASSTAQPFFGTANMRLTANNTGSGHCILTSAKFAIGDPGIVGLTGHPVYTFMVHVRPVVPVATGETVTLKARFYNASNALFTDQPVTTQHLCSSGSGGGSYKKIWLVCQVPIGATQCDMVLDVGPCGAAKTYDVDGAAITPWALNLLDNSSFEVSNPTMWLANITNSNTVTFGVTDDAPEWVGGTYSVEIIGNSAGSAYTSPGDKTGAASRLAIEGGVALALSGSAKSVSGGPNALIHVNDAVSGGLGNDISFGIATTWLRYGGSTGTLSPVANHDYFILVGSSGGGNAPSFDIKVDNVAAEPIFQFVNGTMESGTTGVALPLTVPLALTTSANLGWVQDSTTNGSTKATWTNAKAQSGTLSLLLTVAAADTNTTQVSQYFSCAGWGAIQGTFTAQWQNAGFWGATLQQFDHGGNMLSSTALYFNAGTQTASWFPRTFAVATNNNAAYAKILFFLNGNAPDNSSASSVWIDTVTLITPSAQIYGTTTFSGPTSAAFGLLLNYDALPGGQPFVQTTTPSYALSAGQEIWFAQLLSDAKVLVGTQPFSTNPALPTSNCAELWVFDPTATAWQRIVVPTSLGSLTTVNPSNNQTGGNEIADVQVSGANAYWLSSGNVFGWNTALYGVYPIVGKITKPGTVWGINQTWTAQQVYESNPGADNTALFTKMRDGFSNFYYDASSPGEMAVTPNSLYLIITHYDAGPVIGTPDVAPIKRYSGGISAFDPATGILRATLRIPDVTYQGRQIYVNPRLVETDPTGTVGVERFIVIYDAFFADTGAAAGHPIQEFLFNSSTNTITAKSVPVIPDFNAVTSTGTTIQANPQMAGYDASGNLYVACIDNADGLTPRNTAFFLKTGGSTLERLASTASFPNWATDGHWNTAVTPDFSVAGGNRTTYPSSLVVDNTNHRVYLAGANGVMTALTWTVGYAVGANFLGANDSGFETSVAGWTPVAATCTITQSNVVAHAGTFSMRMLSTSSAPMAVTTPTGTSSIPVTQGQQYQVSAWFRSEAGATPATCYLTPVFYDSAGNQVSTLVSPDYGNTPTFTRSIIDSSAAWKQTYTVFDVPKNASFVAMKPVVASVSGQVHYMDDVVFQTIPFTATDVDLLLSPLRSGVPTGWGLNFTKGCVDTANNRLWLPLLQQYNGHAYSASDVPSSHTQWLYKVAISAGASPPSVTNGPTQWIDGGWSGGGYVGSFLGVPSLSAVGLQRSSDRSTWNYVRGTQGANPKQGGSSLIWGAFGPTFKLTWDDYEWPTLNVDAASQTFYYRATAAYTQGTNVFGSPAGRDYLVTPAAPLAISEWLLIDPLNSANNYTLHVKSVKFETQETAQTYTPLGRSRKVIVADEILGDTVTLTLICWTNADFVKLQTLVNQQATLVLRSPDGEWWYARATKRTRERTWTGAPYARTALRTVTVTFETVDVLG